MVENEVSINGRFSMKINFNLKGIGGKKSQIWLTITINKERVRAYTGLLIEPEFWIKTTRTQVGERASEDSALGNVQLKYNKGINKGLKKILGYCHEYGIQVSQSHLMSNGMEHNAKNFTNFINGKIRGVEANIRKNPVEFINAYIERKSQMVNKDTQRKIVNGTIYNHRNALKRLQKFCEDKHIRLVWELFNAQLEERFTAWMMSKNYTANTIASQYSIMKVWLSEAEIQGLITDKSFHRYRTKCQDVENVYLTEEDINKIYAINFEDDYVWLQIDNQQFYLKYNHCTKGRLMFLDYIEQMLGLQFNNITHLDLAIDTSTNFSKALVKMIRNKDYYPIINGTKITDRKKLIEDILYIGIGNLERIKEYSILIQQKKNDLSINAYNKKREIENKSHKDYIMESYDNPNQLHRLEVRINSDAMKDFFTREHIEYDPSMFINDDWLWLFYLTFLNRVIRFQAVKGRKVYGVMDLI